MKTLSTTFSLAATGARILVADDDNHAATRIQRLFEATRLHVDIARGGREACRKLQAMRYDLIVLQLQMRDLDGFGVMAFLAQQALPTAIIVISNQPSSYVAGKALRRGASDYLRAPYSDDELMAAISALLEKRFLEDAHTHMQLRLQKSEKLHRYIINNSPDIVFVLDMQGNFSFINRKIESLLGYQKKELLGQNYLRLVDDADKHKVHHFLTERNITQVSGTNLELRLKCRDHQRLPRYFEVSFFPIQDDASEVIEEVAPSRPLCEGATVKPAHYIGVYGTARDITERKEAEAFIHFQAYHDLLTRLPNRSLFKDRLSLAMAQAKRNGQLLAVMFLDLDRFKLVNDTLGHAMGDRLLQAAASRLEKLLRAGDTLSRFGGDEFTLLLPAIHSLDDARIIARKILVEMKAPFVLGNNEVFVGVSIGIAVFPDAGTSIEQLLQNADTAMYHVKARGKNGYQFFSEGMSADGSNRLTLERDLRRALENHEFQVYYQPQVDALTGKMTGVEALIRWHHPERGLILPSEFILLAEETNLIAAIGDWVIRTACTEVKDWILQGHNHLRLSVNFSPLQVAHPRFVENLLQQLELAEFPAQNFEIEITENLIMRDLENVSHKLSSLAAKGIRIAIDDFGTGYSSLHYLNKLPIHTLKVDQSFIRDIQSSADESCIVNAIIAMAKGLKLNIVAEGVETLLQLDYLKQRGCHEVQGYYFGRAKPANETLQLIHHRQCSHAL